MAAPLRILFEDNHCIAVSKPSGVVSAHFQGGDATMDRLVKSYLKQKYNKPGNVFLGVVQRLDKPVSGVLLFARTSKAAARLAEQFREGTAQKLYWAIVEGTLREPEGILEDWLAKEDTDRQTRIVSKDQPGARHAVLQFRRLATSDRMTWLELVPRTGRRHQLRAQLAHHGHPIVGDARYGSSEPFVDGIALHAYQLTFQHPVKQQPITLTAELPPTWKRRFGPLLQKA